MEASTDNLVYPDKFPFVANGVTYVYKRPPIGRFNQLQIMRNWLQYHMENVQLMQYHIDLYGSWSSVAANPKSAGEFEIKHYRFLESLKNMQEKGDPAFWICTLFIVREDEDMTTWNPELAQEKIEDWNKGMIDPAFFLGFALITIKDSLESYNAFFQNISVATELPSME